MLKPPNLPFPHSASPFISSPVPHRPRNLGCIRPCKLVLPHLGAGWMQLICIISFIFLKLAWQARAAQRLWMREPIASLHSLGCHYMGKLLPLYGVKARESECSIRRWRPYQGCIDIVSIVSLLCQSALAVLALELAKQLPWLSSLKLGGEKTGLCKWYGQLAGLPSFGQSGRRVSDWNSVEQQNWISGGKFFFSLHWKQRQL